MNALVSGDRTEPDPVAGGDDAAFVGGRVRSRRRTAQRNCRPSSVSTTLCKPWTRSTRPGKQVAMSAAGISTASRSGRLSGFFLDDGPLARQVALGADALVGQASRPRQSRAPGSRASSSAAAAVWSGSCAARRELSSWPYGLVYAAAGLQAVRGGEVRHNPGEVLELSPARHVGSLQRSGARFGPAPGRRSTALFPILQGPGRDAE